MLDDRATTFLEVVEDGSFAKAAKVLLISPIAVMKMINSLESLVGARLLGRSNRGVTPTSAGESLARPRRGTLAAGQSHTPR